MKPRADRGRSALVLVPTGAEAAVLGTDLPGRLCLCGFGLAAAGVGAAHAIAAHEADAADGVVLVGAAGTYDPARAPIGHAIVASSVRLEGIAGGGRAPAELGVAERDVIALPGDCGEVLSVATA